VVVQEDSIDTVVGFETYIMLSEEGKVEILKHHSARRYSIETALNSMLDCIKNGPHII